MLNQYLLNKGNTTGFVNSSISELIVCNNHVLKIFFKLTDFSTYLEQKNTFLSYFTHGHPASHGTSVEEESFGEAQN